MLNFRLIPSLFVDEALQLVHTTKFTQRKYIGDPLNAAYIFSQYEADELLVLDIDASRFNRTIPLSFVRSLAQYTTVPLLIGGGVRSHIDIEQILSAGAERVILGGILANDFSFLSAAATRFGTSSISVIINCYESVSGVHRGYFGFCADQEKDRAILEISKRCEDEGAGEIVLFDNDKNGLKAGFNSDLLLEISRALKIPVVALGGCGALSHISNLVRTSHISGVSSTSFFVFAEDTQEVLLNYPSWYSDLRRVIKEEQKDMTISNESE